MSLRERLRNRPRPSAPCRLRVDDTTTWQRELEEASLALRLAQAREDGEEGIAKRRAAVEEARAALDACYATVTLTALAESDLEALIDEHPPREGTDDQSWNDDTFPRALFLACVPPDVMDEEEWVAFLAENLADGERNALFTAALAINMRAPDGTIPKGLTRTLG